MPSVAHPRHRSRRADDAIEQGRAETVPVSLAAGSRLGPEAIISALGASPSTRVAGRP